MMLGVLFYENTGGLAFMLRVLFMHCSHSVYAVYAKSSLDTELSPRHRIQKLHEASSGQQAPGERRLAVFPQKTHHHTLPFMLFMQLARLILVPP